MPTLNELLVGPQIKDVIEKEGTFSLVLQDGRVLTVEEGGGVGADGGWYNFPVVKLDGKEIWRG